MHNIILNQMINCGVVIGVTDYKLMDIYSKAIRSFLEKNRAKIVDCDVVLHGNRRNIYASRLLLDTDMLIVIEGRKVYLKNLDNRYNIRTTD
jgi:hypothetical protein